MSDVVDLAECAREPIHVPGSIQPHGVLLAVSDPQLRIAHVSESAEALLGVPAQSLVGRPLGEVLDLKALGLLDRMPGDAPEYRNPAALVVAGRLFDAIVQRSDERLLVELEPALAADDGADDGADAAARNIYHCLHHALGRLGAAANLEALVATGADEVRGLIGFDRVMIYRFEPDDHGVVIAEAKSDELEPYLGLHYPATDIPAQARRLYVLNTLRLIPDARYVPSPLVPALDPATGAPLDLSHSVLRSVSPVHLEYLANMGVRASMSISLLHGARLWGLIACHHRTPRFVPYQTRLVCDLFGQMLARQTSLLVDREQARERARATDVSVALVHRMTTSGIVGGLTQAPRDVLDLVGASGAAICRGDTSSLIGATPPEAQITKLLRWLPSVQRDGLYATDRLASVCPFGEELGAVARGLLAISFSYEVEHVILWFRPEVCRTVRWAGDPHLPLERRSEASRLSPRRSFAEWTEEVKGTSAPWEETAIEQALDLRAAITTNVLRTAAQLASLNADLRRALRARDEFLSMASHELRTPLSTLKLSLEVLERLASQSPELPLGTERVKKGFAMATRQLARLDQLIGELLDLSRLSAGRLKLMPADGVDLAAVVRDVLVRFADRLAKLPVTVRATGDVVGSWDASRIDQVVTNLVSNAIKYGNGEPITVELRGDDPGVALVVRDRGGGLSAEDQKDLFARFHRAPSNELRYSGFGLGLWIVKQLVEGHGGSVSVESELGKGASFRVWLPRRAEMKLMGPVEV